MSRHSPHRSPQPSLHSLNINVTPPQLQYNQCSTINEHYTLDQLLTIASSRWFTNDELLHILQTFHTVQLPISTSPPVRPVPGSLIVYDRTFTKRWRSDGYSWKGSDRHVELKVDGKPVINCCYAHSSEYIDLHRRSYWLLDENNPTQGKLSNVNEHSIVGRYVMVHYLDNCQTRKRSSSKDMTVSRATNNNSLTNNNRPPPQSYRSINSSPSSEYRDMYDSNSVTSSSKSTISSIPFTVSSNPPNTVIDSYISTQSSIQRQPTYSESIQYQQQRQQTNHQLQHQSEYRSTDIHIPFNELQSSYNTNTNNQSQDQYSAPHERMPSNLFTVSPNTHNNVITSNDVPSIPDIDTDVNSTYTNTTSQSLTQPQTTTQSQSYAAYILDVSSLHDSYLGGSKILIIIQDGNNLCKNNIVAIFGPQSVPLERITYDVYRCNVPQIPNSHLLQGQPATVELFVTDGINRTNSLHFTYQPIQSSLSPTVANHTHHLQQSHESVVDQQTIIQEQELLLAMLDRLDLLLSAAISMQSVSESAVNKLQRGISGLSDDSSVPLTPTALLTMKSNSMSISLTPSESQRLLNARAEYARIYSNQNTTTPQSLTTFTLNDIKQSIRNNDIDDTIEGLMLIMLTRSVDSGVVSTEHLSSVDLQGRQLIHMSAGLGFESFVAYLLEHDVDVNCIDTLHKTPLHYAAAAGDVYMVTELLSAGADDSICDINGNTAMQCAALQRADGKHNHALNVFIDSAAAEQPTHNGANIDTAQYNTNASMKHVRQQSDNLTGDTALIGAHHHIDSIPGSPSRSKRVVDDVDGYFSDSSAYNDSTLPSDYIPSLGKHFSSMTLVDMGVEVDELEREVAGTDDDFARCVRHVQRKIRGYLYRRHNAANKIQAVSRGYVVRKKLSKPIDMNINHNSVIQQSIINRQQKQHSHRNTSDTLSVITDNDINNHLNQL